MPRWAEAEMCPGSGYRAVEFNHCPACGRKYQFNKRMGIWPHKNPHYLRQKKSELELAPIYQGEKVGNAWSTQQSEPSRAKRPLQPAHRA